MIGVMRAGGSGFEGAYEHDRTHEHGHSRFDKVMVFLVFSLLCGVRNLSFYRVRVGGPEHVADKIELCRPAAGGGARLDLASAETVSLQEA